MSWFKCFRKKQVEYVALRCSDGVWNLTPHQLQMIIDKLTSMQFESCKTGVGKEKKETDILPGEPDILPGMKFSDLPPDLQIAIEVFKNFYFKNSNNRVDSDDVFNFIHYHVLMPHKNTALNINLILSLIEPDINISRKELSDFFHSN